MSYIQVDSRGCGAGKTRNTIIPRIRNNIKNRIATLVVVPSIKLQQEYQKYFLEDEFTLINSEDSDQSVYAQYSLAQTPVICITHEGFLRTPHTYFTKTRTDLIIDEAINPYCQYELHVADRQGRVWLNTRHLFKWTAPEYVPEHKPTTKTQPFFELTAIDDTAPDAINSELWQKISNKNRRLWASWETGNNLMNQRRDVAQICSDLTPDVFKGWHSIWIAAAVFEKTFMGYWMQANRLDYTVVHKFADHAVPVVFHIPAADNGLSWSKSYRDRHPEVKELFLEYVRNTASGKIFYNTNNDDKTTVFVNGTQISHNAHGVNEYSDYNNYVFLSAIKPRSQYKNFIREFTGIKDQEFEFAHAGYMAYQLLMRSSLRKPGSNQTVNAFFLDTDQALGVIDLFNNQHQVAFIDTIKVGKKKPLTPYERKKRWAEKKKLSKLQLDSKSEGNIS